MQIPKKNCISFFLDQNNVEQYLANYMYVPRFVCLSHENFTSLIKIFLLKSLSHLFIEIEIERETFAQICFIPCHRRSL